MKLFNIIFAFQFYFLASVFEIYFNSPVSEYNIKPVANSIIISNTSLLITNTKRLVLFVGDGLPAEHCFDFSAGYSKVPFLRSVIENSGTWGVSHTGFLSGSRPGHIAMIAGFYEDPIAAFRGLMENTLYFDSILNQSVLTFSWGSPDIVPMLSKGPETDHIHYFAYSSEMEEISGRNHSASLLNSWVLNNFKHFIKYNLNYYKIHEKSRVVFLFHLAGTDVAGHANKPYSLEYENTMKNMDMVIKELYLLVEKLFNDTNTTYLFTSDHGMTAWGSHGAGSKIETETPIIAWGAGIKKPFMSNMSKDLTPDNWKLGHLLRQDINQVDIAVLMSILLGTSIPVHSVGTLPLDFLDFSDRDRAKAYILNAKQLITLLKAKEHKVKNQLSNKFFHPYSDMTFTNHEEVIMNVEKAINNSDFIIAENFTQNLIVSSITGLNYYNSYFQNFLLTCTVLSFLGICSLLIGEIMVCNCKGPFFAEFEQALTGVKKRILKISYSFLFSSILVLGYVGALPYCYMIYLLSPLSLWYYIILNYSWILRGFSVFNRSLIIKIILYVLGSQIIVLSFDQKWIISLTLIAFCLWPGLGMSPVVDSKQQVATRRFRVFWCFTCIGLSIFPLLPIIIKEEKLFPKIFTGLAWIIIELIIFKCSLLKCFGLRLNLVSTILFLLSPLLLWNICSTSESFKNGEGLYLINQCISCSLLIIFLCLMYRGPKRVMSRFNTLSFSVGLTFLMFSSSYEAVFPLLLAANLVCWVLFERMVDIRYSTWPASVIIYDEIGLYNHEFRRSFFFVFYTLLSFFGIGNLASLNTFDLVWVRSFTRSFSPLIIMPLMLLKILLPSILVASAFRSVCFITKANSKMIFMTAVLMCDFMALQFLLSIKNKGSSLEIGRTVSHFIVMQSIAIFLFIINRLAKYITARRITSGMDCDNLLRKWHDA